MFRSITRSTAFGWTHMQHATFDVRRPWRRSPSALTGISLLNKKGDRLGGTCTIHVGPPADAKTPIGVFIHSQYRFRNLFENTDTFSFALLLPYPLKFSVTLCLVHIYCTRFLCPFSTGQCHRGTGGQAKGGIPLSTWAVTTTGGVHIPGEVGAEVAS